MIRPCRRFQSPSEPLNSRTFFIIVLINNAPLSVFPEAYGVFSCAPSRIVSLEWSLCFVFGFQLPSRDIFSLHNFLCPPQFGQPGKGEGGWSPWGTRCRGTQECLFMASGRLNSDITIKQSKMWGHIDSKKSKCIASFAIHGKTVEINFSESLLTERRSSFPPKAAG